MMLKKLTTEQKMDYLAHQRRILHKLRQEMEYTRNPSAVQQYIDFARLSIIDRKSVV